MATTSDDDPERRRDTQTIPGSGLHTWIALRWLAAGIRLDLSGLVQVAVTAKRLSSDPHTHFHWLVEMELYRHGVDKGSGFWLDLSGLSLNFNLDRKASEHTPIREQKKKFFQFLTETQPCLRMSEDDALTCNVNLVQVCN